MQNETNKTLYTRYSSDVSEELFDSIYADLFSMATKEQKAIWDGIAAKHKSHKKRMQHYRIGESQLMLNEWCEGKASLGDALDFINTYKHL